MMNEWLRDGFARGERGLWIVAIVLAVMGAVLGLHVWSVLWSSTIG
jgi:uncharacterized membrane protein YeaQ/YmgE (transglycosylase-associated protein family)